MLTIPRHFPIRKTPKRYKPAVNNPNIIPAPTLAAICTVKKKDSRNFFLRYSPFGMTMKKRNYVYKDIFIKDVFKTQSNIEDDAFCKNSSRLSNVKHPHKKFQLRCLKPRYVIYYLNFHVQTFLYTVSSIYIEVFIRYWSLAHISQKGNTLRCPVEAATVDVL